MSDKMDNDYINNAFFKYLAIYNVHFVNIMYFISVMNNRFKAFINLG